jgi:hypothetical protein
MKFFIKDFVLEFVMRISFRSLRDCHNQHSNEGEVNRLQVSQKQLTSLKT